MRSRAARHELEYDGDGARASATRRGARATLDAQADLNAPREVASSPAQRAPRPPRRGGRWDDWFPRATPVRSARSRLRLQNLHARRDEGQGSLFALVRRRRCARSAAGRRSTSERGGACPRRGCWKIRQLRLASRDLQTVATSTRQRISASPASRCAAGVCRVVAPRRHSVRAPFGALAVS